MPTARFAQPIRGAVAPYPMIVLSGLFVPVALLPPGLQTVAKALPFTYAVRLLQGIWNGDGLLVDARGRRGEIVRLWVASVDFREDMAASENLMQRCANLYRKVRNTFGFCLGI